MRILFVLSRIPYPLDKGDKLRAYYQIKELSKNNDVYLFCLNNTPYESNSIDILSSFIKGICIGEFNNIDSLTGIIKSFFNGKPFQTGYYTHSKSIRTFHNYCKEIKPDVIFNQFVRTANYIYGSTPKVLDYQDALSANMEGRASKSKYIKKFLFNMEARRLRKYEAKMFDIFDKLTIIVEADKKSIIHPQQSEIEVLPNGVDNSYFEYKRTDKKEFDIIFSGGMSYSPNIVAANYLGKEIMPLVWKKLPNTKLVIAGSNPSSSVKNLSSKRIIITGWVDDMKEYYDKSKIFIAPMQIGTGLQNKLLEAMAMNLPCITSTIANQALRAIPNKDILIANTPQENANQIILLLTNREKANAIANQGNNFVRENYLWETYGKRLEEILNKAIEKKVI
ncbi:MAG: glycosyltransferase [Bacteroidales bacterium]